MKVSSSGQKIFFFCVAVLLNIAKTTSAERVRTLGSYTTKIGDKVEPPVSLKLASAHKRCAYDQRYCLPSPLHFYVSASRGNRDHSHNSLYYTASARRRIPRARGVYNLGRWRQCPRQLTSDITYWRTIRQDFRISNFISLILNITCHLSTFYLSFNKQQSFIINFNRSSYHFETLIFHCSPTPPW